MVRQFLITMIQFFTLLRTFTKFWQDRPTGIITLILVVPYRVKKKSYDFRTTKINLYLRTRRSQQSGVEYIICL